MTIRLASIGAAKVSRVDVLVSVEEGYKQRLSEVVKGCEGAGMYVEQQLKAIGVITGSIESEKFELLCEVPGVSHVAESRDVSLSLPDSLIQ